MQYEGYQSTICRMTVSCAQELNRPVTSPSTETSTQPCDSVYGLLSFSWALHLWRGLLFEERDRLLTKSFTKWKNLLQPVTTFSVGFDVALMYGTRKTFVIMLLTSASQQVGLCTDYGARQLFGNSFGNYVQVGSPLLIRATSLSEEQSHLCRVPAPPPTTLLPHLLCPS